MQNVPEISLQTRHLRPSLDGGAAPAAANALKITRLWQFCEQDPKFTGNLLPSPKLVTLIVDPDPSVAAVARAEDRLYARLEVPIR